MNRECKVPTVLVLAVVFCFASVSVAEALGPIWKIYRAGTNRSINWKTHSPNPRFAINKRGTPSDPSDDIVLDRATGLVWARDANLPAGTESWVDAMFFCRNLSLGNCKGWRLPTEEELASLVDSGRTNPCLPVGSPFVNVQYEIFEYYWSSTSYEDDTGDAWSVSMSDSHVAHSDKTTTYYVWPVRGGNGYATGNW